MASTCRQIIAILILWNASCLGSTNLPPVFTQDMNNLPLSESTQVGTVVYTLQGIDPEGSTVKYGLVGSDKFKVDPDSGDVTLIQPLDREVEDTLKFLVSIEDQVPDSTNNHVQVPVTVIVLDENDNAPTFTNSPYEIEVPEDTPIGATVLTNILVEDVDSVGDNLEVGCVAIEQWPDACDIFELQQEHSTSNQYNGSLILRRKLNYNEKQFYRFQLVATDGLLNGSSVVLSSIGDVQDSPPVWVGALEGVLAEDVPVGTIALKLKARDGDRARPRDVILELVNNPLDFFLLDAVSGELKTAKPLDREALPDPSSPLKLTVRATELVNGVPIISNISSSLATVSITIKDVNDEPPRFNKKEYHVEIPESLPLLTPLPNLDMMVTDRDVGINSLFSIRLSDKLLSFLVEPQTGSGSASLTLRLNSTLDYEDPNQRKFIIEVIAEELETNPRLSSVASVTISVIDVNDNPPLFSQSVYKAEISETAVTGTKVISVTATDRDTGRFGVDGLVYQLYGNGAELFVVDNRTGDISVAECATPGAQPCLDFDTKKDYFLHYKATDDDGLGQSTVVSVQISLVDANDNAPVFDSDIYKAAIDEDANKFEPELQVQARDIDSSSEIRYSIVEADIPFWIEPHSGRLFVTPDQRIQANEAQPKIVFTVLASDGVHNATCKVEVLVRDVNNHSPTFEQDKYEANILEDAPIGTFVSEVKAIDLDTGINSQIKYSIQKGAIDAFAIDNTTGIIIVSSKLDYDVRNTYRIQIIASDQGLPSLTGTTELKVQVINVNDKLPFFTPTVQRAEVSADAEVGTIVHHLTAVDPDVSDNSQLVYKLNRDKPIKAVDNDGKEILDSGLFVSWFSVLSNGSVLVSSQLQRDEAIVLTLPVKVIDVSAKHIQEADGELTITIVEVNRHAPSFSQYQYIEHFAEEQPVGSILGTYSATDKETAIAAITIQPPNEYFSIDNVTGTIRSITRIDYERIQVINLNVVAVDSGVPALSATASLTVLIDNVNDETPEFTKPMYEANVTENTNGGTHVLTITAYDQDLGEYGTISYSLSGELSSLFSIDENGLISVNSDVSIDREQVSDIHLKGIATDHGNNQNKRSASVPIHIKVIDVNDNAPIFTQKVYKSTIAENLQIDPPAAIVQVLAEDKDQGLFGLVRYSILEQSEEGVFRVDPSTGIIYPSKPVKGDNNYRLRVLATDEDGKGMHFDSAKVDINVFSVNKHSPQFEFKEQQSVIEVLESSAKPDYLITTIKATDQDSGENGHVTYYLKVDNRNVEETNEFTLNKDTGELRTKTFLDREHDPVYQLVLVAMDNGAPAQFESLHFLTIVLKDSNDNVPHFPKQMYEFTVLENQPVGITIGSIKAIDKDSGEHGDVFYHVLEGNDEGALTLEKTKGNIKANISFDREQKSEYSFTVYASNNPILEKAAAILNSIDKVENQTQNSIAVIKVKVLDENDNAPKFDSEVYYAGVKHTSRINEPIIPIVAHDYDLLENGSLVYVVAASHLYKFGDNISSGSIVPSPFTISQDGMLMTASYMAEYNQDRFVLDVVAKEMAPPYRQAKAQVIVWVIDRSSLLRLVLSRSCPMAQDMLISQVTSSVNKATGAILVPAKANTYVHADTLYQDWCEVQLIAIWPSSSVVLPVSEILERVDAQHEQLRNAFSLAGVETLVPATANTDGVADNFDPALAALIALLIVLFTGIVTFIVVCACLKNWVMPPPSLQSSKGESLLRKRILEELSTTENPLWLENKLRPYEEQELSMNVFGDQQELNPHNDNTYATIQGSRADRSEYATLGEAPTASEAAMGFQGSTFKPTNADTPEPPPRPTQMS